MPTPRPLTRAQTLQNRAFLTALRLTGNVREAARQLGVHRSTFTKRRAKHPAFAADWDAALAVASANAHARAAATAPARTGTPRAVVVNGRLQLRRATRGRLTQAAKQAFLLALSASANIRLAAAAAGFSHSAFYRLRERDPGFAREMRLALEEGYARLELALLERFDPCSFVDDEWRHNERPEVPPMTTSEGIQLLYLHQKEVRLGGTPDAIRRRHGESRDAHRARLDAVGRAAKAAEYERFRLREAEFRATGVIPPHVPPPPFLPDLSQVKGWSKARPDARKDAGLFGGWSVADMSDEAREAGLAKGREGRG